MKISERAERFARKFVKPKPVEDTRSKDEKMAEFRRDWITDRKRLRDKIKTFRGDAKLDGSQVKDVRPSPKRSSW